MTKRIPLPSSRLAAFLLVGAGLLAIAFVLLLLNGQTQTASASREFSAVPVAVNYPAPDLSLHDLDGNPISLRDYRGVVVMVNLWATWCPPCKEEMPTLVSFYEKYKHKGFVLIAINQEESREVVLPFVREYGLTFPVWLDPEYLAEREFKTMNLPSSFVIDRAGNVRLAWIGGISMRNLEKYVPDVINQN